MKEGKVIRLTLSKLIYGEVTRIEAIKSNNSMYKGEAFFHDFDGFPHAKMWGCTDRRFLIIEGKEPLWEDIEQDDPYIPTTEDSEEYKKEIW